jgi:hypothetical protein
MRVDGSIYILDEVHSMKKILWLLPILFLTACSTQTNTAYLVERISLLEEERSILQEEIAFLEGAKNRLTDKTTELEEQLAFSTTNNDKILDSFMNNLNVVAELLGVDELNIPRENVNMHGDFVTAYFNDVAIHRHITTHHRLELIFQYEILQDEVRWTFLSYNIGGVSGPGILHSGRFWQGDLFAENFIVRFFPLIDWGGEFWGATLDDIPYFDEEISPYNWQEQIKNHMIAHNGIRIADLWYEGQRLIVDLTPAAAIFFDWGSSGSQSHLRALIDSLATLPNVAEIEVLVGGQRGISASHFSFVGVFYVNQTDS